MRTDLLRWGGISSVVLAVMLGVGLALGFTMGVDIYDDGDIDKLLTDINDNQELVAAWAILGAATPLLFAPTALGFIQAADDRDRWYLAVPAAFVGLSAVLAIIGSGAALILPEIADNYVGASGAERDALLHDGETLQSWFLLIGGAAYIPFGLTMLSIGVLALRSGFFPRWFAWASIIVGAAGAIPFVGFIVVVPGRVLWLAISGVIMLRRSSEPAPTPQAASRVAPATA